MTLGIYSPVSAQPSLVVISISGFEVDYHFTGLGLNASLVNLLTTQNVEVKLIKFVNNNHGEANPGHQRHTNTASQQ